MSVCFSALDIYASEITVSHYKLYQLQVINIQYVICVCFCPGINDILPKKEDRNFRGNGRRELVFLFNYFLF